MKDRLLCIVRVALSLLILTVLVSGCTQSSQSSKYPTPTRKPTTQTVYSTWTITLNGYRWNSNNVVTIDLTIKNVGTAKNYFTYICGYNTPVVIDSAGNWGEMLPDSAYAYDRLFSSWVDNYWPGDTRRESISFQMGLLSSNVGLYYYMPGSLQEGRQAVWLRLFDLPR